MSWWPFGKDKSRVANQEQLTTVDPRGETHIEGARSEPEQEVVSLVAESSESDLIKEQIDALVLKIESALIWDRVEFLKIEKPLKEMATQSRYADQELKALRKRFFSRLQAKKDSELKERELEAESADLVSEFAGDDSIESWFDLVKLQEYEDQTLQLVLDIKEGNPKGLSLADLIERRAHALTGYTMRYGAQGIRSAAEIVETNFFEACEVLFKFLEEREATVLPQFRRLLATSTNKYGDRDYAEYVDEVSDFCYYASKNEDLVFAT